MLSPAHRLAAHRAGVLLVLEQLLEAVLVDRVPAAHHANRSHLRPGTVRRGGGRHGRAPELAPLRFVQSNARGMKSGESRQETLRTESKRNSKQTGQLLCMERSTH